MASQCNRTGTRTCVLKYTIAILSDPHCGSTIGLHPDISTQLSDGGFYLPSEAQQWLWQCYEGTIEFFKTYREGDFTILLNGDLFDGDHHNTDQIVSRHPGTETLIAHEMMRPLLAMKPDQMVVIRGTECHTGKSGSKEEALAAWLAEQTKVVAGDDGFSHFQFRGDFGHVRVDATHHGVMGRRFSTKNNPVLGLACDIYSEHVSKGHRHPDIAIRSHWHRYANSGDAFPTQVLQTPAFQLATAHVHRVAPGQLADIGGLLINIDSDNEEYIVRKKLFVPKRSPVWVA